MRRVPAGDRVVLAARHELIEGELADRLQHAEPQVAVGALLAPHQTLVEQRLQVLGDRRGSSSRDGRRRFEVEPADKDAEAAEQRRRLRLEQVVAPGDGVAHGLLAGRQVARPIAQQPQAILHLRQQRLRREELDPGRRQLDGERQPVEGAADRGHRGCRRLVEGQCRPHRAGTLQEEAHRLVAGQERGVRRRISRRHRQGIDGRLVLAPHVQGRPAGGQHLERGTGAEQRGDERRGGGQEVLAVVEQQQGLPRAEDPGQLVGDRSAGAGVSPAAVATVVGTSAGSASGARSTQMTPSAKAPATSSARARARRVLPTPPGPVRVSSGTASSSRACGPPIARPRDR